MTEPTVLPTKEFDQGSTTAAPAISTRMAAHLDEAKKLGVDIQELNHQAKTAIRQEAKGVLAALEKTANLLFLGWQRAQQRREGLDALALARLFNSLTYSARELNERHQLINTDHIKELEFVLGDYQNHVNFDLDYLARTLDAVARERTHDRAWPWVVLPTFARQPYGRILLLKVDIPQVNKPVFVTQPTFLSGRCTLFHTHGLNWAISRPLGNGSDKNTHINTLWMPRRPEAPFPLRQLDLARYDNRNVVAIPPCVIHGISRKRGRIPDIPSLHQMQADKALKGEMLNQTRFGEMSCLHIYCPHMPLVRELADSPIVKSDGRFFIEYDMIVFDHYAGSIWSGGGGSWPQRMVEFGSTGDHCGICFEDDPRRENLDPRLISDWLIKNPAPQLIKFDTL
jgi:hypothetical protein